MHTGKVNATEGGVNATEVIHKESLAYRKAQFKRNTTFLFSCRNHKDRPIKF